MRNGALAYKLLLQEGNDDAGVDAAVGTARDAEREQMHSGVLRNDNAYINYWLPRWSRSCASQVAPQQCATRLPGGRMWARLSQLLATNTTMAGEPGHVSKLL